MDLMELIEELSSTVDERKFAVGLFIDLKKAFDTIDIFCWKKWKGMESEGWDWNGLRDTLDIGASMFRWVKPCPTQQILYVECHRV